jgi:hypothetical protein
MTSVYVGVSSLGDCPLVQAQVVQLNASSGHIQQVFNVVPTGCTGGSVWGSPTIDPSDGSLYVATGNDGDCSSAEPYTEALVKLRASNMSVEGSWQVPLGERTTDSDFGSTPTLFGGTVTSKGTRRSLVGVANKNGTYYVFDRAHVGAGPVARLQAALAGDPGGCPECGDGSISPSAWDGRTLYVAGGNAQIQGASYPGNVSAWNPNNLSAPIWRRGLTGGPVLGSVVAAPGIVAAGAGSYTDVLRSRDGNVLLHAPVSGIGGSNAAIFYGPPSIACGVLFEGDTAGNLYAYAKRGFTDPCPPEITALRLGKGSRVSYVLSERATVFFTIDEVLAGGRHVRVKGTFRHTSRAGVVSFRFTSRLGKHALKPGTYRLSAIARTRTGARSAPVRVTFTVRP